MQHSQLAAGRWYRLSLLEQLGNVGSEVGRALKTTDVAQRQAAAARALELLDLTLADRRWYGRGSELARAREVVCDFLYGPNDYNSSAKSLEAYFGHFALAARLKT